MVIQAYNWQASNTSWPGPNSGASPDQVQPCSAAKVQARLYVGAAARHSHKATSSLPAVIFHSHIFREVVSDQSTWNMKKPAASAPSVRPGPGILRRSKHLPETAPNSSSGKRTTVNEADPSPAKKSRDETSVPPSAPTRLARSRSFKPFSSDSSSSESRGPINDSTICNYTSDSDEEKPSGDSSGV